MVAYLRGLPGPKVLLWCYLLWYGVAAVRYFEPSPTLWASSLGLSAIIGTGLYVSTAYAERSRRALGFWRDTLGLQVHKEATVKDQGVRAALLPCGETEIELLEPIDPEGGVAKFLAKRGEGLHHLCFESDDVATELATAKANGLPMLDEAPRAGLAGMIGFLRPLSLATYSDHAPVSRARALVVFGACNGLRRSPMHVQKRRIACDASLASRFMRSFCDT